MLPMYSAVLPLGCLTVAWYTTFARQHSPGIGQDDLFWQLQRAYVFMPFVVIIFLLCALMIDCMLGVQL